MLHSPILLLAPHSDDEILMGGGLIAMAIKEGVQIAVAVVTNGDYLCTTQEKGSRRLQESLEVLRSCGVPENQIFFWGYPDTGMAPEESFLYRLYHASPETLFHSACSNETYGIINLFSLATH